MKASTRTATCSRCERTVIAVDVMDEYGACPACSAAICLQVAASMPHIAEDCEALGRFHQWCRAHDDRMAS